jgi:hypothetical protein
VVHHPQFPNITPPDTPVLIAPTSALAAREKYVMVLVTGSETETSKSSRKATKKSKMFKNRSIALVVKKLGGKEESKV